MVIVFFKRKSIKRVPGYISQVSGQQVLSLSLSAGNSWKTMEKRYHAETNMKKNS